MTRTTLIIPEDLKLRVQERARTRGISFAEYVREALEARLQAANDRLMDDPLFSVPPVYDGPAPDDISANHDRYLYGNGG